MPNSTAAKQVEKMVLCDFNGQVQTVLEHANASTTIWMNRPLALLTQCRKNPIKGFA